MSKKRQAGKIFESYLDVEISYIVGVKRQG